MRCFPAAKRAVFGLSLLLVACSDEVTAPAAPAPPPATAVERESAVEHKSAAEPAVTGTIAPERAVAVAVEDVIERVLPMLGGEARTANLGATLRGLVATLEAGEGAAVTRAAAQAYETYEAIAALDARSENEVESRVHLDLVGLVIARARDLDLSAYGHDRSLPPKNDEEHHDR